MNVSNGGLIAKLNENLFFCDLYQYSGTRILSEDGVPVWDMKTVMWFAASDGRGIYCSNQRDYDYLTYLDGKSMTESRLIKRACFNLVMFNDRVLFIDEEDGFIYEYDPEKAKCALVIKEKTLSFILISDKIFFASENGLKSFDTCGKRMDKLYDCSPVCLNYSDGQLIFADKARGYIISCFDIRQDRHIVLNSTPTQSMITTEEYVFVSSLADNNAIVRININTKESIRFCGENSDKLHIVGDYLYFLNLNENNAWYRVPLSGGRPMKVFNQ